MGEERCNPDEVEPKGVSGRLISCVFGHQKHMTTKPTVEAIYNDFHTKLKSFTMRHVPDADTADDILQDVYLKIHAHVGELRDTQRLESWIYQITRNAIADYHRGEKPEVELPETLRAPADEQPDTIAELAGSIGEMLRCLPAKYREALELSELQGLSQAEVARRLKISLSGAKSRVQRAREKMKEAFLECCHFEINRYGRIIAYQANCPGCAGDDAARGTESGPSNSQ